LTFKDAIEHTTVSHPNSEIKLKLLVGQKLRTMNYKITPELCREEGRKITVNTDNNTLHVSRANTIPKDSPFKKVVRFSDATQPFASSDVEDDGCSVLPMEDEMDGNSEYEAHANEIISLLPSVFNTLKECGLTSEFISFNKLLSEKKFPMDNIAFLLFLDVVRWFSLDNYTSFMRYNDEIKLFWRTGLRLFGGRFLRFMGGPKNKGQKICGESLPGKY
jgi:hypothetical protein